MYEHKFRKEIKLVHYVSLVYMYGQISHDQTLACSLILRLNIKFLQMHLKIFVVLVFQNSKPTFNIHNKI